MYLKPIAHIRSDFPSKFGIPRQSGRVKELKASIVFEPEFRVAEAFRGLEEYSHIWLIWEFSESVMEKWSPTVRPPRLGGNTRKGVFATRSPFRPNPIGLSSVKLEKIEMHTKEGPVLHVSGADLMNGTPIYDIKPYLAVVDCHPDAKEGFSSPMKYHKLQVICPEEYLQEIPQESREGLLGVLADDPRPGYQKDSQRIYGMGFAGKNILFRVEGDILTVCGVEEYLEQEKK